MADDSTLAQYIHQFAEIDRTLADAYEHHGMQILNDIEVSEFIHWTDLVAELGHRSPVLALAFINASPLVLPELDTNQRTYWARMGLRLSSRGWKSIKLACQMFECSYQLLQVASTENLDKLVDILCDVSDGSAELATSCLQAAPTIFESVPRENHEAFLDLALAVASRSRADIWLYFERGPDLLSAFQLPDSNKFVALAARIISQAHSPPFGVLLEISRAIGMIDAEEHPSLYDHAQRIADRDGYAAVEFLKSAPRLRELLSLDALNRWVEEGLGPDEDAENAESLRAFFAMESSTADESLVRLSGRVEFERTGNLLQWFGQALGGEGLHVQPIHALTEKNIGWVTDYAATTDGHNIFVPAFIDTFDTRDDNFDAYRISIAHQCGRLQFGSFSYQFAVDGRYLPWFDRQPERTDRSESLVPIQRYFNLFEDRVLISTLFAIVEDTRVDANVSLEYPGLGSAFEKVKAQAVRERQLPDNLPLRQAFLENLIRASLGFLQTTLWPDLIAPALSTAVGVLRIARRIDATVQDSAAISAWLYDFAVTLPHLADIGSWRCLTEDEIPHFDQLPDIPGLPKALSPNISKDSPDPLANVGTPDFRGTFKPELIQALDSLADQPDLDQLDIQAMEDLIENSVEIESDNLNASQIIEQMQTDDDNGETTTWENSDELDEYPDAEDVIRWCRYDEWDFRANDYLHGWCRLGERLVAEGDLAYYENTLACHHRLVLDIRRQFEMMRPESHRKIRSLDDGHEIDLEQAIEFVVDKKAGAGSNARFYSRRDKVERSVAAAFLLDMSWSTDDPVRSDSPDVPQRIIDIERDSTVLIIEALEAIGDAYGIFGFSGYGRHDVSFHTIKDLEESLGRTVKKRVDGITPMRSTRMGAAIRHARAKLEAFPARVKLLILVSDGRPQDQGYGQGRDDFHYGVHDTKQALVEVKRAGMVPFVITVDREGPDYLKDLCGDIGYEIIGDVESLPRRLPSIYRHLAS